MSVRVRVSVKVQNSVDWLLCDSSKVFQCFVVIESVPTMCCTRDKLKRLHSYSLLCLSVFNDL